MSGPGPGTQTGRRLGEDEVGLVLAGAAPFWGDLAGARLFVTGGTGFVGCWLLETLTAAQDRHALDLSITVLTRSPAAFRVRAPHLAGHPRVRLVSGDVRTFDPPAGGFDLVVHAATDSQVERPPTELWDTIVDGTRRVLRFARDAGVRKVLLLSSGAVYGPQPPDLELLPEDFSGAPPLAASSVYGEGKRAAELLAILQARDSGMEVKIARCFAFVGPHLAIDAHFAIGNFIRDALQGGPVRVRGDGRAVRSYLYASDLTIWLLAILARGRSGAPYNVGSERAVTIADLAREVVRVVHPGAVLRIEAEPESGPAHRYVPSTARAFSDLRLAPTVELDEAIRRTASWYASRR